MIINHGGEPTVTTYQSVRDVPDGELMCLDEDTGTRVLCERCHLGLLGFDGDPDDAAQPGQECARCGFRRSPELREHLDAGMNALYKARLAGATDADIAEVLRDVRYYVANERWKRGEGPPPSVALGL